jgi:nitric oxide reductase subunit C
MTDPRCSFAERATPGALCALGALFLTVTLFTHSERGIDPAAEHATPAALAGRAVWHRRNCASCHQLYGLGGFMGPDLTNELRLRGRPHVENVLRNGWQNMPKLDLSDAEVGFLVDYLDYVGRTGTWPQKGWRMGR